MPPRRLFAIIRRPPSARAVCSRRRRGASSAPRRAPVSSTHAHAVSRCRQPRADESLGQRKAGPPPPVLGAWLRPRVRRRRQLAARRRGRPCPPRRQRRPSLTQPRHQRSSGGGSRRRHLHLRTRRHQSLAVGRRRSSTLQACLYRVRQAHTPRWCLSLRSVKVWITLRTWLVRRRPMGLLCRRMRCRRRCSREGCRMRARRRGRRERGSTSRPCASSASTTTRSTAACRLPMCPRWRLPRHILST